MILINLMQNQQNGRLFTFRLLLVNCLVFKQKMVDFAISIDIFFTVYDRSSIVILIHFTKNLRIEIRNSKTMLGTNETTLINVSSFWLRFQALSKPNSSKP